MRPGSAAPASRRGGPGRHSALPESMAACWLKGAGPDRLTEPGGPQIRSATRRSIAPTSTADPPSGTDAASFPGHLRSEWHQPEDHGSPVPRTARPVRHRPCRREPPVLPPVSPAGAGIPPLHGGVGGEHGRSRQMLASSFSQSSSWSGHRDSTTPSLACFLLAVSLVCATAPSW